MAVINLTFRYRGLIDFKRFYKEGMAYWADLDPDVLSEKKYKDKGGEFEGVWAIEHKMDAYFLATYEVDFKATEMSATKVTVDGKEKTVYDGMIRIYVEGDVQENYEQSNIAGNQEIFKADGILHKIFKIFAQRKKEDEIEDMVVQQAHGFINLVKEICKVEAQDG